MGAVLRRETSGSAWWHLLLFFFSLRVRFSRNTRLTVSCRASTSQIIQPWSLAARDGEWRASKHKRKMWARYGSRTRGVNPPNPPPKTRARVWVQSWQELINISPPPPKNKPPSADWWCCWTRACTVLLIKCLHRQHLQPHRRSQPPSRKAVMENICMFTDNKCAAVCARACVCVCEWAVNRLVVCACVRAARWGCVGASLRCGRGRRLDEGSRFIRCVCVFV